MWMLPDCGYTPAQCDRICWLIAHHHTYTDIQGLDHQILVEADFLVNIFENGMEKDAVEQVRENTFKTKTGTKLLGDLFCDVQKFSIISKKTVDFSGGVCYDDCGE